MNFLWLVHRFTMPVHPLVEATLIYVTKITDTPEQCDDIDTYTASMYSYPNLECTGDELPTMF